MVPKLRFKEFCGEWEEKRLGDVFKFMPTNSFSRNDLNYIEGDIYNIHYGDIHMIYPTITDAQKETFPYINREKKLDVCSELLCEDGDVLLADTSEDYDDIGKAIEIINVGDKKIVSGLHTIFMKDYKKIYANKFRGFMMNSNSVRKQIKVLAAGAKVLGISKSNIAKVKMPLPSLPEQIKIADFLSIVDDKIQNQQDKIAHLENIKKGFMQKIFSRKIRFKDDGGEEFPEWEEKKLGDIADIYDGTHQTPNYVSSGIPFVSLENIKNLYKTEKYIELDAFKREFKIYPQKNDILMTRIGDIGTPCIVEKNDKIAYYVSLALIKIHKNNKVISNFLLQYIKNSKFQSELWKRTLHIAFPKKINKCEISRCLIYLPCLKEQQKIADFLSSFDEKISIEKETLEYLKQLKKGLLQRMFV